MAAQSTSVSSERGRHSGGASKDARQPYRQTPTGMFIVSDADKGDDRKPDRGTELTKLRILHAEFVRRDDARKALRRRHTEPTPDTAPTEAAEQEPESTAAPAPASPQAAEPQAEATAAIGPYDPAAAMAAKIAKLDKEIERIQSRALPHGAFSRLSTAAWVTVDGVLALSFIGYGVAQGITSGIRNEYEGVGWRDLAQSWNNASLQLVPWVVALWCVSIITALIALRRYKHLWALHSMAKFPFALLAMLAGFIPAYWLSHGENGFAMSIMWICGLAVPVTIGLAAVSMGYGACVGESDKEIDAEVFEVNRQISNLTPKPPPMPPTPAPPPAPPIFYDNVID
jgi:hypothetical protein